MPLQKSLTTSANDREETLTEEDEIRKFLSKNAAIDNRFRDIPVPTINYELLVKNGKLGRNVTETDINLFCTADSVKKANIYRMPEKDYRKKIKSYIHSHEKNWENIITEMTLEFPFPNTSMEGVEILDSPGICTRGGIADITEEYIKNADAFIFAKSAKGGALAAGVFNDFIERASMNKRRDVLFLAITSSKSLTADQLAILQKEAHAQFDNIIESNHIVFIDSLLKLKYDELYRYGEGLADYIWELAEKELLDVALAKYYLKARNNPKIFLDYIEKESNFKELYSAIDEFGHKAHYITLITASEILFNLANYISDISKTDQKLLTGKIEMSSFDFQKEIDRVIFELKELENKFAEIRDQLRDNIGSASTKELKLNCEEFTEKMNAIDKESTNCTDDLIALHGEYIEKLEQLEKKIASDVIQGVTDRITLSSPFVPQDFLMPHINYDQLKNEARQISTTIEEYEVGITFKKIKTRSIFNRDKFYKLIHNNISKKMEEIRNNMQTHIQYTIEAAIRHTTEQIQDNCALKQTELVRLEKDKQEAEVYQAIIDLIKKYGEESAATAKSANQIIAELTSRFHLDN